MLLFSFCIESLQIYLLVEGADIVPVFTMPHMYSTFFIYNFALHDMLHLTAYDTEKKDGDFVSPYLYMYDRLHHLENQTKNTSVTLSASVSL